MKIVVLFNLREGVDAQDYERWARTTDMPAVRGLKSIDGFDVLRCTGLLGSDDAPPYAYVELIDVGDEASFGSDIATERMQEVAAKFQSFADSPLFVITEAL